MKGKFLGTTSSSTEQVPLEELSTTGIGSTEFPGGRLIHHASASVYEDSGILCAAFGEPRFLDSEPARQAASAGPAAGWLTAFRSLGREAPARVRGRFAAMMIRPAQRRVIAATDRFATWSFCYAASPESIVFAERADDVAGPHGTISTQALFDYLFFHVIPAPMTVYDGVYRLPPAHVLDWERGNTACVAYWQPKFEERRRALTECEAEFLQLIEEAVDREAVSGTTAAFLSGGTDSSTVAGMLCRVTRKRAKTYSIGFDAAGYDEIDYARIAASHFGTEHHEYYVTPGDLLMGIPKVATGYEQPFGNSSAVPALICAERAKADGVDKLLAGDGGDELFGGNTRYAKQLVFNRYTLVPGPIRRLFIEPALSVPAVSRIPLLRKASSYVQQARVPMPDRLHTYNLVRRLGAEQIFEPDFLAVIDVDAPFRAQRRWWSTIGAPSMIDRMLAFDWKYTLADNDLPKVIGTTRMAGLDVGFPLLADELLEFALRLPPEWKLRGQTLRWFFKRALRDFLPETILSKRKHGFGLPFGVWMCADPRLAKLASDTLGGLGERGIVRPLFIETLLCDQLPAYPGYYGEMVWILIVLELWLRDRAPDWRFA